MEKQKGFTLVELMTVVFIVGILAAMAIPLFRGRIDSARWSEGKASASSIRTAARAFCCERDSNWGGVWANVTLADLGFNVVNGAGGDDLDGKYFTNESYAIVFTAYNAYTITVTAAPSLSPDKPSTPASITLDQNGVWTEIP